MIRQRFGNGRIARIGTWTLAAITSLTAWINHQADAAATEQAPQGSGPPATVAMAVTPAVPDSPHGGLLILRYERPALPPPPTIVRRIVVEKPGDVPETGPTTSGSPGGQSSPPASAGAPAAPPLPPAALPAPPPLQSRGS